MLDRLSDRVTGTEVLDEGVEQRRALLKDVQSRGDKLLGHICRHGRTTKNVLIEGMLKQKNAPG